MMLFSALSALLLAAAVVLFLDLTPERITDDLMRMVAPRQTLRDKSRIAHHKKKSRRLADALAYIQTALAATGKGGQFTLICALSLFLAVGGAVFAVAIGNLLLVPILGAAFALLPFLYARGTIAAYEKHVKMEMETALSIITTSYVRTDDIVAAVQENIRYLKPPVRDMFRAFLGETTLIRADIKGALSRLRAKVDDDIWREWCDSMIACQDDRTLKDALLPIVNKLTDVRIVNDELKTMLYEPRKEYWTMVALVIGNIPLLYLLNTDWFATLTQTLPGKIVTAVCGVAVFVTAIFLFKFTKPIIYKR